MSKRGDPSVKGTLTLKIASINTFMTKFGERIESPPQEVAGIGWYIRARPKVVDNVTYLTCRLAGKNPFTWSAAVDAVFRIVKKNGGGFGKKSSFRNVLMGKEPLEDSLGWTKFVTSEELLSAASGFVVDDSVEIRVDFSVTDVCGASINVFETAGALAADIKLKVGDSVFYANTGYLSVVSSVFRDMFALTESAETKKEMEELELTDLDAGEFKEFLGVIYPTCYPITDTNVISLFRIADRFDVQRVIADCERHLRGANSVPWFDKLLLAVDLNRSCLRDHLISEMECDDLEDISQNEDKDELGIDVLQALFDRHIAIHHS